MRTVPKPACGRDLRNFVESPIHAFLSGPELEFAHTWRVDHCAATLERNQLTPGCRVAPATVGLPHLLSPEPLLTEEAIDDGRFPHSRGAQKRDRSAICQARAQTIKAVRHARS